jgi:hypothetical protein
VRKLVICISLVAGLLVPAMAMSAENPARQAARKACISERAAIGASAFRLKYGAHGALGACITQHGGGAPKPRPHPKPKPKPHPHPHPKGNHGGGDQGNQNHQN